MAAVGSSRRPRTAGTFVRFANDPQHEQERALRERLAAHPGKIVGVGAEFDSVITSQFSKYQKQPAVLSDQTKPTGTGEEVLSNSCLGGGVLNRDMMDTFDPIRKSLNHTPGSPATATLAGQAEATLIKREISKQFEPQLEIKVNKRIFSANPVQMWHDKPQKDMEEIHEMDR